jgi:hypothetical protein
MPEQHFEDSPAPHIILHIILFVLAIFWPFLVVGVSVMGARIFQGFELGLGGKKEKAEGASKLSSSSHIKDGWVPPFFFLLFPALFSLLFSSVREQVSRAVSNP